MACKLDLVWKVGSSSHFAMDVFRVDMLVLTLLVVRFQGLDPLILSGLIH